MNRWISSVGAVALSLSMIAGCSKSDTAATPAAASGGGAKMAVKAPGDPLKIAVIPKATADVFWQSVHAGAMRAANEDKNIDIRWQGPAVEAERSQQIGIVDNMMSGDTDALCLAPCDSNALVDTINNVAAKTPVVLFDSGATTDKYTAFVATDNFKGGQLAGERMLQIIGEEGGELAIVRVLAGSQSTTQREEGFKSVIAKNPKIKLVAEPYGDADKAKSQRVAGDILAAHPGLKAFYGPNESTAFGILGALADTQKKPGEIKFVGFDSNEDLRRGLESGMIDSLVLQDPVQMGYLSVKAAIAACRGQKVEKEQPIAPTLITHDTMKEPKNDALLNPKLEGK